MKKQQKKPSIGTQNPKNKNNSNSGEQLVEQIPIKDTPFTALKFDGKWYLAMGKYRLTHELNNYQACVREAKDASWNRILQVIQIMIETNQTKTMPKIQQTKAEPSETGGLEKFTHNNVAAENGRPN